VSSGLLARTAATARVLGRVRREQRIPYASRDRLIARRDARVRDLARYAAGTVPFYRDVFRAEGIDPDEILRVDDLARLPLIDRDLVLADPERFRSASRLGAEAVPFRTNGTTGLSLLVHHDRDSLLANMAFGERERIVETHFVGRRLGYTTLSVGWDYGSTAAHARAVNRSSTLIPGLPRVRVPMSEPFDRLVQTIDEVQPEVIRSCGSHLEAFFRLVAARDLRMHLPKVVLYGSDSMSREGRTFIEERFGVPVISRYNCVECFKIGFLCEEREVFHLHEDLCHVRVLRPDGSEADKGEVGEVVISNLVNRGTVLLNYQMGDIAALVDGECPCGRELALLTELQGRANNVLYLADGSFVHEVGVWVIVRRRPEVIQFQLVQRERSRFELRLSTATPDDFARLAGPIISELTPLLGEAATIEPVYREELPPGPRGKFRYVVPLGQPDGA
jgi:phenylacetate-CoA ligase